MPKGGARTVSGPPPDPNALRRERDQSGWTTLPFEGRPGDAPEWPLVTATDREWDLWQEMWARPQAVMWEVLGQQIEVAMFVRKLGEAELPGASVELQKVVRQYLDSLGLSVQGMLRNRWRIAPAESDGEAATGAKKSSARRSSSASSQKARLKVVSSGEGG